MTHNDDESVAADPPDPTPEPMRPRFVKTPTPSPELAPTAEATSDAPLEAESPTEGLPWIEGEEQSVDAASITMQRWIGLSTPSFVLGIALFVLTLIAVAGGLPMWVYGRILVGLGVLASGIGTLAWRWPTLHHRHLSYRVDPGGLQIRHGVLWRKLISVPITRVQHVDVTQGPVQRIFDLATLTLHTAGTEGASIPLSGLRHSVALNLRDHLLPANRRGH